MDRKIDASLQCTIYSIVGVISCVSNVLIILTILKTKKMRTKSNYLLVNLAITNLLILIFGVPITCYSLLVNEYQPITGAFCDIAGFLILVAFLSSNFNLSLIAMHRYLLIAKNQFYMRYVTNKRLFYSIIFCWCIPTLISLAPALGWGKLDYNFGRAHCMVVWEDDKGYLIFLQFTAFTIPLAIMIFSYYKVITTTKRSRKRFLTTADEANTLRKKLEQQLTIMLLAVVIVFFTCFMPYAIMIYTEGFFGIVTSEEYSFCAMIMAYANSCCEFWIYFFMSRKFRIALGALFQRNKYKERCNSSRSNGEMESFFI